jgi:HEAT repeat protein
VTFPIDFEDSQDETPKQSEKPTLDSVIQTLEAIDEGGVIPANVYYGLSDLSFSDLRKFEAAWSGLPIDVRRQLVQQLSEASESNIDLNYQALGFLALNDLDEVVRETAIDLLWYEESSEFMNRLVDMAQWDENQQVRARAISELGRFILLGEYEEIPESDAARLQDLMVQFWTTENEELDVRRRALESLSRSSHELVPEAIQEAYDTGDRLMQASALFAMGQSYDQRWSSVVTKEILHNDPAIRYEAARAAGELELSELVSQLGRLAIEDDREIKEVAIWSLGEIGGNHALRLLSALAEDAEEAEDEPLLEAIEDAIASASMVGGMLQFDDDDER